MKEITRLSGEEKKDFNQLTRWIINKDKHADELSEIVTYYFMGQRIKPVEPVESGYSKEYDSYVKKMIVLHKMMISAMKSKQTTDLKNVEDLRSELKEFKDLYFAVIKPTEEKPKETYTPHSSY
jgi:nickel superoxide dismutase